MGQIKTKNRKHGRNEAFCKIYRNENRREKSKARKLAKHLRKAPWDKVARAAFDALPPIARKGLVIPDACPSPAQIRAKAGVTLANPNRTAA